MHIFNEIHTTWSWNILKDPRGPHCVARASQLLTIHDILPLLRFPYRSLLSLLHLINNEHRFMTNFYATEILTALDR